MRSLVSKVITGALALAGAAGCAVETADVGSGGPRVDSHVDSFERSARRPRSIDVLIVVDDTVAMADHAAALDAVPALLEAALTEELDTLGDVHVAVTASDGAGILRAPAGAAAPFLAHELRPDFTFAASFGGSLATAVAPLLPAGSSRATPNQLLASIGPALAAPGFVRDDAVLAIVTIAGSDDASVIDVASLASTLEAHKPDPSLIRLLGIHAAPAPRLDDLYARFSTRAAITAIDGPLDGAFARLRSLQWGHLDAPCMRTPADVDLEAPGPQYDCAFEASFPDATVAPLSWCHDGGPARCLDLVTDSTICSIPGYDLLAIRGFVGPDQGIGSSFHPTIRGQCVVEEQP